MFAVWKGLPRVGQGGFNVWEELHSKRIRSSGANLGPKGFGFLNRGSETRVLSFLGDFRFVGEIVAPPRASKSNLFYSA